MASGTSAMQCGEFINYVAPRRPQVIDPKPGFKRVVNNFSRTDYQKIGLCAVVSLPFGYFAGALRTPPRFDFTSLPHPPPHSWMLTRKHTLRRHFATAANADAVNVHGWLYWCCRWLLLGVSGVDFCFFIAGGLNMYADINWSFAVKIGITVSMSVCANT